VGAGLPAHTKCRLSENPCCPTVFVAAFFCIDNTLSCPRTKVKCFSAKESGENSLYFRQIVQNAFFCARAVDKWHCLWFNDIRTYRKDIDGNLPLPEAPESRRLVEAGAKGLGILIPESVL